MNNQALVLSGGSVGVDKNDVLAIAVSRAEQGLNATVKQKTAEAKLLETEANKKQAALVTAIEKRVTMAMKPAVDAFKMAVELAQPDKTPNVKLTLATSQNCDSCTATLELGTGEYNDCVRMRRSFPLDETEQTQLADINALRETRANHLAVAMDARKKLTNIGTLERQMRARLAEKALENVDGGAELIAALTSDLDQSVAALPGF